MAVQATTACSARADVARCQPFAAIGSTIGELSPAAVSADRATGATGG
jgi:hypothetical protein